RVLLLHERLQRGVMFSVPVERLAELVRTQARIAPRPRLGHVVSPGGRLVVVPLQLDTRAAGYRQEGRFRQVPGMEVLVGEQEVAPGRPVPGDDRLLVENDVVPGPGPGERR